MRTIRICIVEDHAIVRAGLRMLIENQSQMEVIWEVSQASEALSSNREQPDIILLDLDLGRENGLDFIPRFLERFTPVRVLVLTASSDTQVHLRAVGAGASGILLKEQAPEILLKAIESVHAGEVWFSRALMTAVAGQLSRPTASGKRDPEAEKIALLTPREMEIVQLIREGLHSDRIARQLRISEGTVRNHLTSILSKLELSNKFDLAVYAFRHGLGTGGKLGAERNFGSVERDLRLKN